MACPLCAKPTDQQYRPFCSKRCADVDLYRWLTEGYVLEGENVDAEASDDEKSDGLPEK